MTCMLDTNWRLWKNNGDNVGWPGPGSPAALRRAHQRANTAPGWSGDCYCRVAQDAREYAAAGFAAVNLPPSTLGAAGGFSGGYDLKENYWLGSPENPTAFGTVEELRRAVATVRGNGMQVYGDLVLHQYDGFDPTKPHSTLGADGVTPARFAKLPSFFVGDPPGVEVDPVPDSTGNFGFGAMASYVNSTPPGEMLRETIAAVQWLTRTVGFDGFRIDDVKGTNWGAVRAVLGAAVTSDLWAFGEYFDGNPTMVSRWVNGLMQRRSAVLDFAFKFNVQNICNNGGRAWMGALSHIGYCADDPFMAVTFCESADTDNSPGEQIIWNKLLGYAIQLTFPGYPRIYYRDWSTDAGCYGLKVAINNLIYIHNKFANGAFVPRLDTDPQVFVHERLGLPGLPGCLAAFNNDLYRAYTRTVQTSYAPGQRLHEYTGKHGDVWADGQGRVTFEVPKNDNGTGYLVFAEWVEPEAYSWRPRTTAQTFTGANEDLYTRAAIDGEVLVASIWPQPGTSVHLDLQWQAALPQQASVELFVADSEGSVLPDQDGHFAIGDAGEHSIMLKTSGMPKAGVPFAITATYTGAETYL